MNKDEAQVIKKHQPEIPRFVATEIEEKNRRYSNFHKTANIESYVKEVRDWYHEKPYNAELFYRSILDGYTVAKEKQFYIKVKNTCPTQYVWLNQATKNIYFDGRSTNFTNNGNVKNIFTQSELSEIADGELYDPERIEFDDLGRERFDEYINPLFELISVDDEK